MKDFLKKLCYYDHPAEGAFAAETFLLLLPGIALALYLLCGGSLFDRKFVFGFFLSWPVLPSIRLIIELAVLLTLTAWFSFYRREVMQNKKTALFLCAVILIAVLYGYCGGPLPWLAIFLILLMVNVFQTGSRSTLGVAFAEIAMMFVLSDKKYLKANIIYLMTGMVVFFMVIILFKNNFTDNE